MDDPKYLQPYKRWIAARGTGFGATLWASPQSQHARFEVFAELEYMQGKRILDAGCSEGDLALFLLERSIEYGEFIGVDAIEDVIINANARHLPRSQFHVRDLVTDKTAMAIGKPDVVCISGTLNTMTDEQVFTVLENAWEAAEQSLLFNFLSDRCGKTAPPQDQFARRLSLMNLLDWALSKTWRVVLRQDYFPAGHDATIAMYRV